MTRFILSLLVVAPLFLTARCPAQTADDIVGRARRRIEEIDSINRTLSGSFVQRIANGFVLGDQSDTTMKNYLIVFVHGRQDSRTPVPETDTAALPIRLAPKSLNVLATEDVVLPFISPLASANANKSFSADLRKDTLLSGTQCYTVGFRYFAQTDSSLLRGGGLLYVAKTDYTPVAVEYDFDGSNDRRGKFISNVSVALARMGTGAYIAHNKTHISFMQDGEDYGWEQTTVDNSGMKLQ